MMFWKAIEYLNQWEREHLPGADTPQGSEVLVWLLRSQAKPRPLKDLYRSSRYSEPTVRACLKTLVELGFVTIEANGQDMRTRFARVTPKFEATIKAYQQRFQEAALLSQQQPASTAVAVAAPTLRPHAVRHFSEPLAISEQVPFAATLKGRERVSFAYQGGPA